VKASVDVMSLDPVEYASPTKATRWCGSATTTDIDAFVSGSRGFLIERSW